MKTIADIVNRTPNPVPWSEGDNIPWDDQAFSERMLAEHLSQNHDLASRRQDKIEAHLSWIFERVLKGRTPKVLDLGCGPGLYTQRLASRGARCVGIDFAPAAVAHGSSIALP